MPKHRNPPQNFIVKNGSIYLTGARKKLSQAEEDQLRAILTARYWGKLLQPLQNALLEYKNRCQSVTNTQPTNQEGNNHE